MNFNQQQAHRDRDEITHRRKAIRTYAERAAQQREAIIADPQYLDLARRPEAKRHRDAALAQVAKDATARIVAERAALQEVRERLGQQVHGHQIEYLALTAAAQAAGQRIGRMLDAGVPLKDVLQQAADASDEGALAYLQANVHGLVMAEVAKHDPRRIGSATSQALASDMFDRLATVRWAGMSSEEQAYHDARRAVTDAEPAIAREASFWTKVARGTNTPGDRLQYGMAVEPAWQEAVAVAESGWPGDGPVEVANTPVAVEA